jgi:hypothetical protein
MRMCKTNAAAAKTYNSMLVLVSAGTSGLDERLVSASLDGIFNERNCFDTTTYNSRHGGGGGYSSIASAVFVDWYVTFTSTVASKNVDQYS